MRTKQQIKKVVLFVPGKVQVWIQRKSGAKDKHLGVSGMWVRTGREV